ncbi:NAD(P)H-binding protein [Seonamhaeicola sp. ML3]|uniref:NmrA family NAD(P)-binding protein n=1 Tax=Seonamhaeicola sp. ML3 TaxID=2937786 RepID=UPI00200D3BE6|nr:NAD(P)H-binding protein [Seonamhaeicola sp. ML3]
MNSHNYLVIGGTGKTGRKVVNNLKELGLNVSIGSRNSTPKFDWQDTSTWAEALEDIDRVYITFQPDLAVPGALQAIEHLTKLAKAKGVSKLALLSGKGETEAEACEQVVINSGIDYTIIRASWFNQNFSESFFLDPILSGHVYLPSPEAKVPYVDTSDIADVVTEALLHDEHNGQIYEITGPRLLTFEEVIQEIAKATKRDIQFTPVSLEDYIGFLKQENVPDDYVWLIEYLFSNVLVNPNNSTVKHDVEQVLKRKAKDFSEYVTETAKTGVWDVN